uniref:Uncharacterized protein n=1 Tax=Strongyloides papillosus TaxID=174720 RepID=A0A0N5C1D1_STREA
MDTIMDDLFLKLENLIERKEESRRQIWEMTKAIPGFSGRINVNYPKFSSFKTKNERTDLIAQSLTKLLNIEKPIERFGKKNLSRKKINFERKNAPAKEVQVNYAKAVVEGEVKANYEEAVVEREAEVNDEKAVVEVGAEVNYKEAEVNDEKAVVEVGAEVNYQEAEVNDEKAVVEVKADVNDEKAGLEKEFSTNLKITSEKKFDWNDIIEKEKLKERS